MDIFPLCYTSNYESYLVCAVTEGFAGHIGGQTVEDQISAGRAGGDGAVIGIKRHTGHFFFVVLTDRGGVQIVRVVLYSSKTFIHFP